MTSRSPASLIRRRTLAPHPGLSPAPGFYAWYDASQIQGVSDGGALSTWLDLTANANDLTLPSGAGAPLFYNTTPGKLVNGLPAVWFDPAGSDMFHCNTTGSGGVANRPQPFTWFAVVQDQAPSSGTFRGVFAGSGGFDIFCWNQSSLYKLNASAATISGGTVDSSTHVICYECLNTGSDTIYVDGMSVAAGNAGNNGVTAGQYFGLGGIPTTGGGVGGDTWDGPICEVLLYGTGLSSSDRATTTNYLLAKWA